MLVAYLSTPDWLHASVTQSFLPFSKNGSPPATSEAMWSISRLMIGQFAFHGHNIGGGAQKNISEVERQREREKSVLLFTLKFLDCWIEAALQKSTRDSFRGVFGLYATLSLDKGCDLIEQVRGSLRGIIGAELVGPEYTDI